MSSIKVAVRVRPLNKREQDLGSKCIIEMNGKKTTITNTKLCGEIGMEGNKGREFRKEFVFDHSYWSADSRDAHFVTQEKVFKDLGSEVLQNAYDGYNACLFAYGQTSAGKTYTMMGAADQLGLIPRICKGLFSYISRNSSNGGSFRTEVSYSEIYNEHVRDLLRPTNLKKMPQQNLKVREHPKEGPYVEGLTKQHVSDFESIEALVEQGNNLRATASTRMNDHSSRSHAIFTIRFTQAKFVSDMPSETISKIHLVDLAGSERASASGASGERLKEGGNINKSLVTLGIVISTLADNSLMANQEASGRKLTFRRKLFVPYRDSVLTFLLKDSLGGNSKTIMIAAISPAECNYGESLSTLRYANRAKNIINKPTVNEDPNVKIIRDLRQEIERLRTIIRRSNLGPQNAIDDDVTEVTQKLEENQAKVEKLTKDWTEKWKEAREIMQESELALRRQGSCVVLVDLELPHLVRLEEDPLRTEIMLYRLMHGKTRIGREDAPNPQDIVLEGEGVAKEHCVIEYTKKDVFVEPLSSMCWVNGVIVSQATKLIQGDVLVLGKNEVFKFNFPVEAAKLREKRRSFHLKKGESTESLSSFYSNFRGSVSDLALRGSHGDLSFRSESPTQITVDSGVEEDLGEGVASDRANIDELKIQLSDLIAKHKESEARRVEVEKSYQEEIMCKWKEIEEQKDIIQTLREQQDSKADEAQIELDKMRTIFDEQSIKDRKSLEEQINLLVELKHKDRHLEENDKNEVTADEKTSIMSYLEEHWSTIEQAELKLAEIQLQMNKAIEQSEIDLLKHTERMNWEKQEELNEIDLERKTLEELNTKLSESFATSETNLKEKKVYLQNNIETGYQQLNDVENVIKLLEEQQQHFFEKLEIDPKEVKRKLLEEQRTGKHKLDEVREKVLVFEKEIQNGLDGAEKSNLEQRYLDLESELQNLCCFKKEKQETVNGSKKELSGLISKVEMSRKELLSNEEQLLRVRQRYFACEKKHDENLETNLDILKNERNAKMDELMNERERCVVLLQNEYQRMEDAVSNACDITSVEQELSVKKVLEAQKCVVMSLIKAKRDQVETGGTANVLDYLTRRAKFEREQERMIEQQKKVSEHILADIREKELSVRKLTSQRDQFHFEREKERLAIRKRIQRIERAKSVDDIQSEYTLEFYKEESKKLREAFERVTEAETRLTSEVREKEAVLLQLEATRAKLLDVEEDHEDSENRVKELEALRQQKDAQIAELRKHIEDEKRKYLEHLKSEDYEIIEKPLVNRLHVKYRVLGNHAAAEVLKEALLAANVTEMKKQIPWYNTTSSENTGGWIFQGSQKNVAILRKREETASGFIHCFLGRGIIEVDAQTVWEAVRNPLSRYIYDNMLKKINIVEHVEEGLKVVYMLHETSQCFMTHSRDFCFVTKERVEKEKFVQASQSIDHQRCPHVSGIIRGQILSSGWLVERCNVDGKNASVVWYITKVHLGDTTLPWRLIDLLSKRQPLSIAYLNSYLTPS